MKERLHNWLTQVEDNTQECLQLFGHLDKESLNWKPNAKSWSVGQNIDHLIQVNTSFHPNIYALLSDTHKPPFLSRLRFLVKFFNNFILKSVQAENPKKVSTFPVWEPEQSNIEVTVFKDFEDSQAKMKDLMSSCEHLLGKGIVITSPASSMVFYSLETAFDIVVIHQKRHFLQASRVLEAQKAKS